MSSEPFNLDHLGDQERAELDELAAAVDKSDLVNAQPDESVRESFGIEWELDRLTAQLKETNENVFYLRDQLIDIAEAIHEGQLVQKKATEALINFLQWQTERADYDVLNVIAQDPPVVVGEQTVVAWAVHRDGTFDAVSVTDEDLVPRVRPAKLRRVS